MSEEDFIQFQPEESPELQEMLIDRFDKAVLGFAFSKDKMALESPRQFLVDLIKSEFAKGLFFHFLKRNATNFEYTDTEDQSESKIDFYSQNEAWTLIHNFIHSQGVEKNLKFRQLPALIPNASEIDLWSGRHGDAGSMPRKFVFTFLDESDMRGILPVVENKISQGAMDFLTGLNRNFNSGNGNTLGFSKMDIENRFREKTTIPSFHFHQIPTLYIGGVAGQKEFDFFAVADDDQAHGYAMYSGKYYDHNPSGGLSFLNGTLLTKIKNATCPMEALPAFKGFLG